MQKSSKLLNRTATSSIVIAAILMIHKAGVTSGTLFKLISEILLMLSTLHAAAGGQVARATRCSSFLFAFSGDYYSAAPRSSVVIMDVVCWT